MNRIGTHPYGASKAALEMATEVGPRTPRGPALTVNIVNPGAGANTPGMADEVKDAERRRRVPRLVEPEEMVPPMLFVASREADAVNGWRFDANLWDPALPPREAAWLAGRPAGFVFHPQESGELGAQASRFAIHPLPQQVGRGRQRGLLGRRAFSHGFERGDGFGRVDDVFLVSSRGG